MTIVLVKVWEPHTLPECKAFRHFPTDSQIEALSGEFNLTFDDAFFSELEWTRQSFQYYASLKTGGKWIAFEKLEVIR